MTFTEGDEILVTQKDGEWWTGSIDDRTGIFPSNYVRPKDQDVSFGFVFVLPCDLFLCSSDGNDEFFREWKLLLKATEQPE